MNDVNNHQRSNYRLLGLVGNGQFGRVYCGVHRKTGQLVAIKYLHRHSLPTHAFLRELHCLLSLAHPNIVACHALEHCNDGRRLVLEYCAGGTLRSHMLTPLSLAEILALMSDVLCGLAHAHQRGVVHCDIKPENILLSYYDGRWRAKISDFGIAKLIREQPYRKGSGQTGSPAYMAPERFYCQYSPAADIYAVGVILFELLVGRRPFTGTPTALQLAHLNQPVPLLEQLVGPLQSIVTKALEKLPARRYPDAMGMLADLQGLDLLSLDRLRSPNQVPSVYCVYVGEPVYQLTQPVEDLKALSGSAVNHSAVNHSAVNHSINTPQLLMAHGSQLAVLQQQSIKQSIKQSLNCSPQILDGPIQRMYPSSNGLIVSTQHTLWHGKTPEVLTPLACWQAPTLMDIGPHHRWAAAVTPTTKQLTVIQLRTSDQISCVKRPLSPDIAIHQVLAVDGGHFVIVGCSKTIGTQLQLWNRRGMYLTSLDLGITVRQLTPTRQPHQWMAIDANALQTVIFLTLKPLRMTRVTLDISPVLMLDLPWGYLFSNAEGRILLLDRELYPIGGIQGPLGITAVVPMSSHELLMATWQGNRTCSGAIHCLNLQDFNLDLIF